MKKHWTDILSPLNLKRLGSLALVLVFSLASCWFFPAKSQAEEFSLDDYVVESVDFSELEDIEDERPADMQEVFPVSESDLKIPELKIDSEDAEELNERLAELKDKVYEWYRSCMQDQAFALFTNWNAEMLTDQILSVEIDAYHLDPDFNLFAEGFSFLINIASGEQLTDADLLSIFEMTAAEEMLMLEESITNDYDLASPSAAGDFIYSKGMHARLLEALWQHDWESKEDSAIVLDRLRNLTFRIPLIAEDSGQVEDFTYVKLADYLDLKNEEDAVNPDFVYLYNYLDNDWGMDIDEEVDAFLLLLGEFSSSEEKEAVLRDFNYCQNLSPLNDFLTFPAALAPASEFEALPAEAGVFYLFVPRYKAATVGCEYEAYGDLLKFKSNGTTLIELAEDMEELEITVNYRSDDYSFILYEDFDDTEHDEKLQLVYELNGILDDEWVSGFGQAAQDYAYYLDLRNDLDPKDMEEVGMTNNNLILALPKVEMDLEIIDEFNQEIEELYDELVGAVAEGKAIDCDYWINQSDDILSIVTLYSDPENIFKKNFIVYNIDLETGERLSDLELLNRFHSNPYETTEQMLEVAKRKAFKDGIRLRQDYFSSDRYWFYERNFVAQSMALDYLLKSGEVDGFAEAYPLEHSLFITPAGRLAYLGFFRSDAGSGVQDFAPELRLDLQASLSPESSIFLELAKLTYEKLSEEDEDFVGFFPEHGKDYDYGFAGFIFDLGEISNEEDAAEVYLQALGLIDKYSPGLYLAESFNLEVLNAEQLLGGEEEEAVGDQFYLIIPREENAVFTIENDSGNILAATKGPCLLANFGSFPAGDLKLRVFQAEERAPQEIVLPYEADSELFYDLTDLVDIEDVYIEEYRDLESDYGYWAILKSEWLEKYLDLDLPSAASEDEDWSSEEDLEDDAETEDAEEDEDDE